jgi:hypothetical protein
MVSRRSFKRSSNDDYNDMFLVAVLLSQQSALLPLLLSQAKLKQFLPIAETTRRDRRIPRCALLAPGASPFVRLYNSHNEPLSPLWDLITPLSHIYSTNLSLFIIVIPPIQETGRLLSCETEGLMEEDHNL